jgi:hypothetical protein
MKLHELYEPMERGAFVKRKGWAGFIFKSATNGHIRGEVGEPFYCNEEYVLTFHDLIADDWEISEESKIR